MPDRIGIIGLGRIGLPAARHLLAAGHRVTGCDLRADRRAAAAGLGAAIAASPAAVAAASDTVIVMVGFDDEVLALLDGTDGLAAGLRTGAAVVVCSTVSPTTMRAAAAALARASAGVAVVDAPLCRGEPAAQAGRMLALLGGAEADVARCRPLIATFAPDMYHLGGLGAGQAGKLVNNLLLWASIAVNAEGLALGARLGVEPERLRAALLEGSGRNWALETWERPRAMPWAEKDMDIVLAEAGALGQPMPMGETVRTAIAAIKRARGLGPPDPER